MDLLTVTVIDKDSSETRSKTFSTDSVDRFKNAVEEWEKEFPFRRYELITDELIEDEKIIPILNDLQITF